MVALLRILLPIFFKMRNSICKNLQICKNFLSRKSQLCPLLQFYLAELSGRQQQGSALETGGTDPRFITTMAVSNVTFNTVTGRRYDYHDPDFHRFISDLSFIFAQMSFFSLIIVFPFLAYVTHFFF